MERPYRLRAVVQPLEQILKVPILPPCDAVGVVLVVLHADAEHVELLRHFDRVRAALPRRTESLGGIPAKFFKI